MKLRFAPRRVALLVTTSLHAATVDLRILETTDLHSNMMKFDYYKDTPADKFGLVRTASLIYAARQEATHSGLVDKDDLSQGSRLGDYRAANNHFLDDCSIHYGENHPPKRRHDDDKPVCPLHP